MRTVRRVVGALRPATLTGPILDKELRVSSRRWGNFLLRFLYLAGMGVFVVLIWLGEVEPIGYEGSAARRTARMAEAGKLIIAAIVGFQFVATQLAAVILLSTSISEEVYHRTLGTLMTTPITGVQIIFGKLLSKLWQLLLLLAMSLPLLAVVRVLGGVPWDYVLASLCITGTAVLFTGAVTIHFSMHSRRAFGAILKTLLTGAVIWALIPFLVGYVLIDSYQVPEEALIPGFCALNPFAAMAMETTLMRSPGITQFLTPPHWPTHCLIMLVATALVLLDSVLCVRRVALAGAFGGRSKARRPRRGARAGAGLPPRPGRIRRVVGSPILWKELRAPPVLGGRRRGLILLAIGLLVQLGTYGLVARDLNDNDTHAVYVCILVILGMFVTAVITATSVTLEKESRTWLMLMGTPLSGRHILLGKAAGAVWNCLPAWAPLWLHLLIFSIAGLIHPVAMLPLAMLTAWLIVLFTCTGLFYGVTSRRTVKAVAMNLGLAVLLWAVLPAMLALGVAALDLHRPGGQQLVDTYLNANPVVQAVVSVEHVSGSWMASMPLYEMSFSWVDRYMTLGETLARMTAFTVTYCAIGLLFALLAHRRLRTAGH